MGGAGRAGRAGRGPGDGRRRGLTLIELLVVLFIILLISIVALPTVYFAFGHRQVSEAARILQGALTGARDKAIHDGQPAGIRLLPDPNFLSRQADTLANGSPNPTAGFVDPTQPLAYNRIVPIGRPPEYSEGMVTTVPPSALATVASGTPATIAAGVVLDWPSMPTKMPPELILVESPSAPATGAPNSPTSWFWNVRVGDKIQIGGAGPWYTVIGPMSMGPAQGNTELFVNAGVPGALGSQPVPTINGVVVEYLALVNGRDDDGDGYIDNGWDGVDNDGDGAVDETSCQVGQLANPPKAGEWEVESWQGASANTPAINVGYTIRRRPAPSQGATEIALPTAMVIDGTTVFSSQERSRLPASRFNGNVDLMVNPDGTVFYDTPYGAPSSFGMADAFYHFWLAERQDVVLPDATATAAPYLPIAQSAASASATLKGNYSLLTLNARTGQTTINTQMPFWYEGPTSDTTYVPAGYNNMGKGVYNPSNPFVQAEQGISSP